MTQHAGVDLRAEFGGIDIYLFDQLLRDRIVPGMRIFDAGCGGGRNLVYFLRAGFDVRAIDEDPQAIAATRELAKDLAPDLPAANFQVAPMEASGVPEGSADVVIASAVLHFARDEAQFDAMLRGAWRVLAPGGLFFARLASTIGIEPELRPLGGRRYVLPDGSDWYLVDEALVLKYAADLGGRLLDPIKTSVVQHRRAMTTWVMQKVRS
jgi:SAM-dependent methyltransferase